MTLTQVQQINPVLGITDEAFCEMVEAAIGYDRAALEAGNRLAMWTWAESVYATQRAARVISHMFCKIGFIRDDLNALKASIDALPEPGVKRMQEAISITDCVNCRHEMQQMLDAIQRREEMLVVVRAVIERIAPPKPAEVQS